MNVIDLEKLENLVSTSSGYQSACPACLFNGEDTHSRNHLGIQRDGKFNCIKYGKDTRHNSLILQLVGTESDGTVTYTTTQQPKIEQEKLWPLDILTKLYFDYSYFESRGISAATQKYFGLGVALSGSLNGRVCVPIFDEHKTKIIGFNARLIKYTDWHKENGIGRWKILGNKKNFVFTGCPSSIRESRTILITEGPADVLALYECGIKNSLCLFGTTISSKQLAFLIRINPSKIVIGLNNELNSSNGGVGNQSAIKLQKVLLNYFSEERVIIALPRLKDYNDWILAENGKSELDSYRKMWLN